MPLQLHTPRVSEAKMTMTVASHRDFPTLKDLRQHIMPIDLEDGTMLPDLLMSDVLSLSDSGTCSSTVKIR